MTQLNTPRPQGPEGSVKLVVIALLLAVCAVVLVNVYILYLRQEMKPNEITVYRLNDPVRAGQSLKADMYRAIQVDEAYSEALGEPLNKLGVENRLGDPFVRSARQGQVLTSDLFDDIDLRRLDQDIDEGKRGIALPVNSRELPGSLREGVHVDIAGLFAMPDGKTRMLPIIENVQVTVAGRNSIIDEQDMAGAVPRSTFRRIEIQLTPQEALQMSQIKKKVLGDFEIYVRNPGDTQFPMLPTGGINPEVLQLIR